MNLLNIRQDLAAIDYDGTKLQTYLVFVPGLSLIIQKIQMANTLPLNNNLTTQNAAQIDAQSRKFANICKWHLRGAMIQMIATVIAVKVFAAPIFLVLTLLAMYELADTYIKSQKSVTFFDFYPNGNIRSMEIRSACNIF